jgi:ppGpp synthetase/RelA/SpoT-type nucleotidyltranferase
MSLTPSRSQIRKAGDHLRRQLRDRTIGEVQSDPANESAWAVVEAFRRAHVLPTGVMWFACAPISRAHDGSLPVPRIKRETRIIEKIARGRTGLERLQDIGGVRIVVPDLRRQEAVIPELLELYELDDVDDYVSRKGESRFEPNSGGPKGSGYRAIHLVHRVHGVLIETQVRTARQHHWAMAAEKAEQSTGYPLKFGDAPSELMSYFRVAADIEALKDRGEPVDADLVEELEEFRERIRVYYRRTGETR